MCVGGGGRGWYELINVPLNFQGLLNQVEGPSTGLFLISKTSLFFNS